MTTRDECEEHRYSLGVDERENQAVHDSVVRADGREGVGLLAHKTAPDHGPHAFGSPAATGIPQKPEPSLVLEHEAHRASLLGLAVNLFSDFRLEFF